MAYYLVKRNLCFYFAALIINYFTLKNNLMKTYQVLIIENYNENEGNPDVYTREFNSLRDAKMYFKSESKKDYRENGKYCKIELWKCINGEQVGDDPIMVKKLNSPLLPDNGVIVTYEHVTYMDYCYKITDVRMVEAGERYEDLNVCLDSIMRPCDAVFDSVEQLKEFYENQSIHPFDKIKSGRFVINEFLHEKMYPNMRM